MVESRCVGSGMTQSGGHGRIGVTHLRTVLAPSIGLGQCIGFHCNIKTSLNAHV